MNVEFSLEHFNDVYQEIDLLIDAHHEEVGQEMPLDPNWEAYKRLHELGMLAIFTARCGGVLVGYNVFFISPELHHQTVIAAVQNLIYIHKDHRGFMPIKFIKWCDSQLLSMDVDIIYYHCKQKKDLGPILKRQGYEILDLVYVKAK